MACRHLMLLAVAVLCMCCPPAEQRSLAAQAGKNQSITSFAELTAFLASQSVPHVADSEKQVLRIPSKVGEPPISALVRWNATAGLVHFVQPVPVKVPRHRLTQMETALTRLNYGLEFPGFGFDYGRGLIYYQMTVPIKSRGGLSGTEVQGYFSYVVRQAREFTEVLDAVANQSLEGSQINLHYQQTRIGQLMLGQFQMKLDDNQWVLSIKADGSMTLAQQGTVVVGSTYELTGKRLRITDRSGTMACPLGMRVGTYDLAVTQQQLTFVKVQDDCSARSKILTVAKWMRRQSAVDD